MPTVVSRERSHRPERFSSVGASQAEQSNIARLCVRAASGSDSAYLGMPTVLSLARRCVDASALHLGLNSSRSVVIEGSVVVWSIRSRGREGLVGGDSSRVCNFPLHFLVPRQTV